MWQYILDLLFPKYCLNCSRAGWYICAECKKRPIKRWDNKITIAGLTYYDEIICAADFDDQIVGQLIKTFKYRFVKELSEELAEILLLTLSDKNISGYWVTAVPLSSRRQRWRGFNQSAEIAKIIARKSGLPYIECLRRKKHTTAQAKLSEAERQGNMKGMFETIGEVPEKIIVIDDVITTGATINECAKVLRASGAEEIIVAAVAKG